jgi:hypothetical protein
MQSRNQFTASAFLSLDLIRTCLADAKRATSIEDAHSHIAEAEDHLDILSELHKPALAELASEQVSSD